MLKPEIARRLGAPLARCERCTRWVAKRVFVGELYGGYDCTHSRALRICVPCKPIVEEANDSRVDRPSAGAAAGTGGSEGVDRPSSAVYRAACQRMLEEW